LQNIVCFIRLFCKRDLQFKEPTNRSQPIESNRQDFQQTDMETFGVGEGVGEGVGVCTVSVECVSSMRHQVGVLVCLCVFVVASWRVSMCVFDAWVCVRAQCVSSPFQLDFTHIFVY